MKIGIISDIHSNADALKTVLEYLKEVDRIICLGDIIGYGAEPTLCIEEMKKGIIKCIKGNHEGAISGELNLSYFNEEARDAIQWTQHQLNHSNLQFISQLKRKMSVTNNILGVHGSPRQPLWEYIIDEQTAEEIFTRFDFWVYFIGHSHIAGYFTYSHQDKDICYFPATSGARVELGQKNSYIINCGSVGQPRDGNPQASFGIFDTERNIVSIKRIDYPVKEARRKIEQAHLPLFLSQRLSLGI